MTSGSAPLRRLAFAGSWYAADPTRLARDVDVMLAATTAPSGRVRAVVAPHAGIHYSGPVAAWSYRALAAAAPEAVVLVGPSHYVPFSGCAMLRRGRVETPWDALPIAEELADRVAEETPLVERTGEAIHAREHSLELQLPFLARVLPGIPVVLILMGDQSRNVAFSLGDAIGAACAEHNVALVASSDLSHYHDGETARRLDAMVIDLLARFDSNGLMQLLERDPHHACGGGPMVAVLRAAKRLGAGRAEVLQYADSGDVSGDKTRVVGYVSAAAMEP
jgi:MEMO1 family protein